MKSYTNIEQSKKLAEILPLESADMYYIRKTHDLSGNPVDSKCIEPRYENSNSEYVNYIVRTFEPYEKIPCWSLAALINALPISIKFKDDEYYLRFMKEYVEYANDEISLTGRCLHTTGNNNLVDACFEMILKLKENDLL